MVRPGICISFFGGYLRILGAPMFNPVALYGYLFPTVYLFMADIENPDLIVCGCRTWICLDITRFYEKQLQPSSGSPLMGEGGFDTICTVV